MRSTTWTGVAASPTWRRRSTATTRASSASYRYERPYARPPFPCAHTACLHGRAQCARVVGGRLCSWQIAAPTALRRTACGCHRVHTVLASDVVCVGGWWPADCLFVRLFVCLVGWLVGWLACLFAFRFVLLACLHPLSFRVRLALQMGLFVCFQLAFVLFLMISSMDAFEQWKQVFHISASPGADVADRSPAAWTTTATQPAAQQQRTCNGF